jgi:hypothetical protein
MAHDLSRWFKEIVDHLIDSISKYWIPGFRIPGDGNDKDSHHEESRSQMKPEVMK